ncbi:SpaH/EbpB family LPXTG-anchored major pilin [Corynebacterium sp.]|uniref:SpaH/EbpB family LPXTG-anchored major pilin n=1 Tax=Corynebacterium sp. TaxID=1720 RepID=UPI0026E08405|nr:SpaH/EbpB family LPXTG-anchored major pilin [Corynebacterium sp.]MDO5512034.1 SpaH/EbpB family LPXTG-anchored major pilin [Corynebacterium sp.]
MKTLTQRSASALAIAGLTLSLAIAGAPGAIAQPAELPAATAHTSLVDYNATGTITVHKSIAEPGAPGTGNPLDPAPSPGLNGVTFELYLVKAIANAADFTEAAAITATDIPAGATPIATAVTATVNGEAGVATFGDLALGLYLVVEKDAPSEVATKAPNFLVYLPMTNPDTRTGWNYQVHAYPKNAVTPHDTEVDKVVEDADMNVGDTITYTITSDIPPVVVKDLSKYIVKDDLDEDNVFTTADAVTVALTDGTTFESGDYTVELAEATQDVTVTFTEAGLKKLTDAKREETDGEEVRVVTTIAATVKAVGDTDGVAVNTATVIHNDPYTDADVEKDSNEVKTYWAKLHVYKFHGETPLKDAEFELYRCTADGVLGDKITIDHDNDVSTPAQATWTTGEDGNLLIDGLHVTDVENNAAITPVKNYCLVETKAPTGYELRTDPIVVTVNAADLHNAATTTVVKKVDVENVPSNTPKLPLTGGMGIGIIAGLAAMVLAAGAWLAKRSSRV